MNKVFLFYFKMWNIKKLKKTWTTITGFWQTCLILLSHQFASNMYGYNFWIILTLGYLLCICIYFVSLLLNWLLEPKHFKTCSFSCKRWVQLFYLFNLHCTNEIRAQFDTFCHYFFNVNDEIWNTIVFMNYITHKTIYLRKTSLRHLSTYFNMEDVVAVEKSPVRKLDIVFCFTFNFTCSLLWLHVKRLAYCHFWLLFFIICFLC